MFHVKRDFHIGIETNIEVIVSSKFKKIMRMLNGNKNQTQADIASLYGILFTQLLLTSEKYCSLHDKNIQVKILKINKVK